MERELEAMAVRFIIDRKFEKGKESEFSELLKQLRSRAVSSKGYLSGETLRVLSDRHYYIMVSTWQSADDWKDWEKDLERQKIQARIEK